MNIGDSILFNGQPCICIDSAMYSKKVYKFLQFCGKNKEFYFEIKILSEKEIEIFEDDGIIVVDKNSNFVSLKNLHQKLSNDATVKKITLIALAFDYGDDYWDFEDENPLSQFLYLYYYNKIIEIAVPKVPGFDDINYVYVREISKDEILNLEEHSRYYLFNKIIISNELTESNLKNFLLENDYYKSSFKFYEGNKMECEGIILNNDIVVGIFDEDTARCFGNGILCNFEEIEKTEFYKEDFINTLLSFLKHT